MTHTCAFAVFQSRQKKNFYLRVTNFPIGRLACITMNFELFETRVLPTKNKLFRFAFRLLGSSEEAKDVVQDVFIKLWNGRDRLAEVQNMEAWCMRITKNLSLDRIRSRQRRSTDSISDGLEIRHEALSP